MSKLRTKKIPGPEIGTFAHRLLINKDAPRLEIGEDETPCCCEEPFCACCFEDPTSCDDETYTAAECIAAGGTLPTNTSGEPVCRSCTQVVCPELPPDCASRCDPDLPATIAVRFTGFEACLQDCSELDPGLSCDGDKEVCECRNELVTLIAEMMNETTWIVPLTDTCTYSGDFFVTINASIECPGDVFNCGGSLGPFQVAVVVISCSGGILRVAASITFDGVPWGDIFDIAVAGCPADCAAAMTAADLDLPADAACPGDHLPAELRNNGGNVFF